MPIDLDEAAKPRAKWYGFPSVGDIFEGDFLEADERQARDYDTDEPKTWDDGSPVIEYVIVFATNLRDDADDDGRRTLYAEKHKSLFKAMQTALREAGLKWSDGPHLKVKRIADTEATTLKNGKKGAPAKQFKAVATRVAKAPAGIDSDLI